MTNENNQKLIHEAVLEKLKDGKVTMRPKWYFLSHTLLIILGVVIVSGFAIFFTSFVIFRTLKNDLHLLPSFGFKGIQFFLLDLPWLLLCAIILFLIVLMWVIQRFRIVYHKPVIYSILAIFSLVTLGSAVIARTPLHDWAEKTVETKKVKGISIFYKCCGRDGGAHLYKGRVENLETEGFTVKTANGNTVLVKISENTRFPLGRTINQGDVVAIGGVMESSTLKAIGIRMISY